MSNELDDHEATGKIQRAPKSAEKLAEAFKDEVPDHVVFGIEQANAFEMAISREKFKKTGEPIFITKEFMNYLLRGSNEDSIMYQGIRVYVDGTKEELDREESMSAETRADHLIYKEKGITPDQVIELKRQAKAERELNR